ncbi:hemerythrin domain-containing protein [Actinoallomurus sp. NBC_01490]|uniref:hemerythrin domain-containing protein n=1 Tax=Actinoallomurus sp. NBC_01490 TaxID=2903557 RepID=UPI002E319059|nr:hemerythrin domain-containing protein [Actinoallomurus sp. NBC_01490]
MIDLTLMYATHDAFRRDLGRLALVAATGEIGSREALRAGWNDFRRFLTVHHVAEDAVLWPALRAKLSERPADLRLLDDMEAEHAELDPLLEAVDMAIAVGDPVALDEHGDALVGGLAAHLDHEETDALPLICETLTDAEWAAFGHEQRRRLGLSGAAEYFPWLLDGVPEDRAHEVLSILPPPLRLVYHALWAPRHRRRPRWNAVT